VILSLERNFYSPLDRASNTRYMAGARLPIVKWSGMAEPIRVFIAGSQGPLRTGLSSVLRADPDITVVGEARDGFKALKKARELKPEVILIDANFDKSSCLETISIIREYIPTAIPVIIADSEEEADVLHALRCGAHGYLFESTPDEEIVQALKKAAAGEVVLSPSVAAQLINGLPESAMAPKLSQREVEVLRLLGEGLKNQEITKRLIVSESTVRTYIYRLQEKLHLKNRHELIIHAGRHLSNFARIEERLKPLGRYSQSDVRRGLISIPASEATTSALGSVQARHTLEKASAARTPVLPERKIVTALSAELTWYNCATKPVDANKIEETINECRDLVAEEMQRYGGTVVWFTSSGLMSFFGVPVSLEHAPQRALHAALAVQEHVKGFNEQLIGRDIRVNARIGINTGAVLVEKDTGDSSAMFKPIGNTTELATKARESAEPGAIVVTRNTYNLTEHEFAFEPLGEIQVDEEKQRVTIHRLVEVIVRNRKPAKIGLRRLTKFVGRDKEIDALNKAFSRAKSGSGQVVGIMGEAGVGKSRLLLEFTRQLSSDKCMYLEGSCRHYGESIAYLPWLQILRAYFNITGEERESIIKKQINKKITQLDSGMLKLVPPLHEILDLSGDDEEYSGLEVMQKRERIFEAIRDILLRKSHDKPIILAIEDCQWIDKTSEECLTHLINSFTSARMMVLLLCRPEYHHAWTTKSYYQHIGLNHLSGTASAELLTSILGASASPELGELVLTKAGGNPLFIEELTRALLENGSIERKDHKYVLAQRSSEIVVPATIQGIIAARLDCLGGDLKQILQMASVIGKEFSLGLLQIVAGTTQLKFHLQDLLGLELIYRNGLDPKSEYVFKHVLIQDVAYHSLLLRTRKKLHERIGDTIEQLYPDRLEEFYETLAHHYQKSQNWEKAYQYLKLSTDKAARSCANREALQHCRDAIDVLNKQNESRDRQTRELEIRLAMDGVLKTLDYPEGSSDNLQRAEALAQELGSATDKAIIHSAMGWYHVIRGNPTLGMKETEVAFEEALEAKNADLAAFVAINLAQSWFVAGYYKKCVEVTSQAAELLERAHKQSVVKGGVSNEIAYCMLLNFCAGSLAHIGHFERAKTVAEKSLSFARQLNDVANLGSTLHLYSFPFWAQGDGKTAAKYLREALPYLEKSGNSIMLGGCWANLGVAYLLQCDYEYATRCLDRGLELQQASGATIFLANFFWVKGWIETEAGHFAEAQRSLEEAVSLSLVNKERAAEGIVTVYLGRALSKNGASTHQQCEQCIMEGMKILEEFEMKTWYAQGCLFLGELYADAGQKKKSLEQLRKAEGMFREMGMYYWLRKTQPLLKKLGVSGNKAAATT
jgi:DNA-binding NarL/FixJ family response regulator/class 3 adenylate cyclase/tetratricopeptide (TPR) repeat protein